MSGLQETSNNFNRADLNRSDFDLLIQQKGRDVIYERGLQCPCKSKSGNQLSTCRNCGGTGWLFINPINTRMIITQLAVTSDFKPWSEEARGTINITCIESINLSFMDKITLPEADAIYNEAIHFTLSEDQTYYFAYSAYPIKDTIYCGFFQGDNNPLQRIESNAIDINENWIRIQASSLNQLVLQQNGISATLKYKHSPVFYVIEMKRETMQSYKFTGGEINQNFPISALARRGHYVLDPIKLSGEGLVNNSYQEAVCNTSCSL